MIIKPEKGYLLAIPFVEDATFKSVKESDGVDQKSKVLVVGDSVMDDKGNMRSTTAKTGDIILHAYSNKEFEINFTKYRFVHFTEVHGIWEDAEIKNESK